MINQNFPFGVFWRANVLTIYASSGGLVFRYNFLSLPCCHINVQQPCLINPV